MREVKSGLILLALIVMAATAVWTDKSRAAGSEDLFTKTGVFYVLWGDGHANTSQQTALKYFLVDDNGKWIELNVDSKFAEAFGSPLKFDRQRVHVVGKQLRTADPILVRSVAVDRTLADATAQTEAITGTKPFVTILLRFADSTSSTPFPATYFTGLMAATKPGMDHYWREASYNSMNLEGSVVVGWYYAVTPSRNGYSFYPESQSFNNLDGDRTNTSFTAAQVSLQFSEVGYTIAEGAEMAAIRVSRSGDVSLATSVDYATSDGTASQSTDYTMASGTLRFSPGETKMFTF